MADYPISKIDVQGTRLSWRDPIIIATARSGAVKGKRLSTSKKRVWKIRHAFLTASELTTLEAFYDANRNTTFTFYWQAVAYTCIFGDSDTDFGALKGNQQDVTITILEV